MAEQSKNKAPKGGKVRPIPIPGKRQSFKDALKATNMQYGQTLARLAKWTT